MKKQNKIFGYSKKTFLKIAGVNKRYYGKVYKDISHGRIITWNWAAFLFGYLWLAYRKAYIEAAFWFSITFLGGLILIPYIGMVPSWAAPIMGLLFSGIIGGLGNFMYAMSLKQKMMKNQPISPGISNLSVMIAFITATIISSTYLKTKSPNDIMSYSKIFKF